MAREYTPHLVQHEYVNSATQKNWAISQVKSESDWLMVLDAAWRIDNVGFAEARVEISLIKFYVADVMMRLIAETGASASA